MSDETGRPRVASRRPGRSRRPVARPRALALVAIVLVGLVLLGEVASAILLRTGTGGTMEDYRRLANIRLVLGGLTFLVQLGAGIMSAVFLYRVSLWLHSRSSGSRRAWRWSPGWAAGGWFIPIANLVIPFLVLREMWDHLVSGGFGRSRAPRTLMIWFVAWVISPVLDFGPLAAFLLETNPGAAGFEALAISALLVRGIGGVAFMGTLWLFAATPPGTTEIEVFD
ncbi:MAG: DUF4328 domain-containing protein [Planctomycetota bacterium]